jgi:hypothetical protein
MAPEQIHEVLTHVAIWVMDSRALRKAIDERYQSPKPLWRVLRFTFEVELAALRRMFRHGGTPSPALLRSDKAAAILKRTT